MIDIFEIGTIKRLPLETSYTNVVAIVHALLLRCPAGTELVIDGTGVGKPVADMFKWHGVAPWCVSSTAGIEQTIDTAARTANVPKLLLISRIQSLLFEGRLKVQDRIAAFLAELRDYRVEYTASEQMTYNAKAGRHDDMVSAAAVAAWRLSDGAVGWGPPTAELAAMVLGLGGSHAGPAPWAIGLDLGKVHDPTALVIMRRVSVDRPELPHRGVEPMVLVPEIPNNKTDELLRREAVGERATPDHPDVGTGGETVHINGPLCTPTYAVGSAEWAEQQQGTPMLDPAMAEFAAEMRTNARLRRPRPAATRRAELIDNSSAPGAAELGRRIQAFWAAAGYDIRIEIVHSGGPHGSPVWGIRSGPT